MPPASRGTIVVVEQSAAAQELMEHVLREAGHRVLVTRNPLEALELGRRVRIDALVADLSTLDREGPGLVPQLRTLQPALSVLYLEDGGRPSNGGDAGDARALQTPFSLDELQEAVAATLARR
jgi:DNA-binding response OmpR family regulator